ncbi:MAG: DUF3853 family protein [Candidatus Ornithobacterium hominis]|nr:DUF3853 family protein [Candidatus Ornithobacterium hominis]MCT7905254.1 DUF3853 family protein [Candidatus Ornithobacterium hominis]
MNILLHINVLPDSSTEYLHGYNGLANFLGCSLSSAKRLRASGKIDEATIKTGRIILFDKSKLIELLK